MKDKVIPALFVMIFGSLLVLSLIFVKVEWTSEPHIQNLPSISEFQQQLKDRGHYEGEIDGLLGPLMQIGWDRAYCEQCARPYFSESGVPEK